MVRNIADLGSIKNIGGSFLPVKMGATLIGAATLSPLQVLTTEAFQMLMNGSSLNGVVTSLLIPTCKTTANDFKSSIKNFTVNREAIQSISKVALLAFSTAALFKLGSTSSLASLAKRVGTGASNVAAVAAADLIISGNISRFASLTSKESSTLQQVKTAVGNQVGEEDHFYVDDSTDFPPAESNIGEAEPFTDISNEGRDCTDVSRVVQRAITPSDKDKIALFLNTINELGANFTVDSTLFFGILAGKGKFSNSRELRTTIPDIRAFLMGPHNIIPAQRIMEPSATSGTIEESEGSENQKELIQNLQKQLEDAKKQLQQTVALLKAQRNEATTEELPNSLNKTSSLEGVREQLERNTAAGSSTESERALQARIEQLEGEKAQFEQLYRKSELEKGHVRNLVEHFENLALLAGERSEDLETRMSLERRSEIHTQEDMQKKANLLTEQIEKLSEANTKLTKALTAAEEDIKNLRFNHIEDLKELEQVRVLLKDQILGLEEKLAKVRKDALSQRQEFYRLRAVAEHESQKIIDGLKKELLAQEPPERNTNTQARVHLSDEEEVDISEERQLYDVGLS